MMGDMRGGIRKEEEEEDISSNIDDPMKEEIRRRNTFLSHNSHSNQPLSEEEEILSAKGFYRSSPTTVTCVSCSTLFEYPLTFPVANIDSEHRKRSSDCSTFGSNGFPRGNGTSVPQGNDATATDGPSELGNSSSSNSNNNTNTRNIGTQSSSHNPPNNINCVMEPTHRMITSSQPRNDLNLYSRTTVNYEAMKSELERLRTFYGVPAWPVSFIEPEACARAGFFYLQNDDRVQCAFCRGIAGEWDEGDVPILEHRRHFPRCPFICNLPVGNIPIGEEVDVNEEEEEVEVDPSQFGIDVCGHGHYEAEPSRLSFMHESPHIGGSQPLTGNFDDVATNLSIEPCRGPVHSNMVTQQSRLKSFTEMRWPDSTGQSPEKMSEAGFYYIGSRDHVKCFYCGGGLRNWESSDDPWVEHARWFPRCTFVVLNKGHEFIKSVMDKSHPNAASNSATAHCSSSDDEDLEKVAKRDAKADVEPSCSSGGSSSGIESGSVGSSERCCNSDPCSSSGNSSGEEDAEYNEKSFSKEKDLEEEVRKLREARQCKICMDNEVSVVFLPCGHLVSCTACATAFTNCALCRQPIKAVVRTYMS